MGPLRALFKPDNMGGRSKTPVKCIHWMRHAVAGAIAIACFAALAYLSAGAQNAPQAPPPGPPVTTSQSPSITPDEAAAGGQPAGSQDPQGEAGQFVFRKKVEEVILHAVVVDQQNDLISNLPQDEFRVYEDGKPQQITSFRLVDLPAPVPERGTPGNSAAAPAPQVLNVDSLQNNANVCNGCDQIYVYYAINYGGAYAILSRGTYYSNLSSHYFNHNDSGAGYGASMANNLRSHKWV